MITVRKDFIERNWISTRSFNQLDEVDSLVVLFSTNDSSCCLSIRSMKCLIPKRVAVQLTKSSENCKAATLTFDCWLSAKLSKYSISTYYKTLMVVIPSSCQVSTREKYLDTKKCQMNNLTSLTRFLEQNKLHGRWLNRSRIGKRIYR